MSHAIPTLDPERCRLPAARSVRIGSSRPVDAGGRSKRGIGSASRTGGRRRSWVTVDPHPREGSHGDQREEPAEGNRRVRIAWRVMAEVTIDVNGATVVAAITKESAERLGLAEGKSVVAIVKATDVMIGIAPV
jgi:molybdopterin-binding protein